MIALLLLQFVESVQSDKIRCMHRQKIFIRKKIKKSPIETKHTLSSSLATKAG